MTEKSKEQQRGQLLRWICSLPKNMVITHGIDNMTEFLLHHLSQQNGFNFSKAAYFIDNPDFNYLKGVAGYHTQQAYKKDHWQTPDLFTEHMKNAPFNQKVRGIEQPTIHAQNKQQTEVTKELNKELSLEAPHSRAWPLKYGNHGILLFELSDDSNADLVEEHLDDSLHLFGFCPVF